MIDLRQIGLYEDVCDAITKLLLRGSEDPNEILKLLFPALQQEDWARRYSKRAAAMRAQRDELMSQPVTCGRCEGLFPLRDTIHIYDLPSRGSGTFCAPCAELARAEYTGVCEWCNQSFILKNRTLSYRVCPPCETSLRVTESKRLRNHRRRAEEAGTSATLTLRAWIATIETWGGQCAYCQQVPFTDLDHFIPIRHGGGTTADNCVPACDRCNSSKSGSHPDRGTALPAEWIDRIRQYLRGTC